MTDDGSSFEALVRLIEQPDGQVISHEIRLEHCRRVVAAFLAEHAEALGQVITALDDMLRQHPPILALFVAHAVISSLRRANQERQFPIVNEAVAEVAAEINDRAWVARSGL